MKYNSLEIMILIMVVFGFSNAVYSDEYGTVKGQAFYRERIAVPHGSQLELVLEDISRADAPADVIGKTVMSDIGQPPYPFEIQYRSEQINPSHRYNIRARLSHEGQLLFITDQVYPVITGGHTNEAELLLIAVKKTPTDSVKQTIDKTPATFTGELPCADCEAISYHLDLFTDQSFFMRMSYLGKPGGPFDDIGRWELSSDRTILILRGGREAPVRLSIESNDALRMMSPTGEPIVSELNYTLRRSSVFNPIEPKLHMRGMYSYMADAGIFTECLTGRKMPVAMEADNRALEEAYMNAGHEPGEALLVTLEGQIAQRMPMEGPGPVDVLIPIKFTGIRPGETCDTSLNVADLQNTYWKLTFIGNEAVFSYKNQREAHIVLHAENRLAGSDGCNRIIGSYQMDGDSIRFSKLGSTRMACPEGMEQADQFKAAMEVVSYYRIVGQHLELLDNDKKMLIRFEAIALK